jgi:hypothetical protein
MTRPVTPLVEALSTLRSCAGESVLSNAHKIEDEICRMIEKTMAERDPCQECGCRYGHMSNCSHLKPKIASEDAALIEAEKWRVLYEKEVKACEEAHGEVLELQRQLENAETLRVVVQRAVVSSMTKGDGRVGRKESQALGDALSAYNSARVTPETGRWGLFLRRTVDDSYGVWAGWGDGNRRSFPTEAAAKSVADEWNAGEGQDRWETRVLPTGAKTVSPGRWGVWCSGGCDRSGEDGWWNFDGRVWWAPSKGVAAVKATALSKDSRFKYEARPLPPPPTEAANARWGLWAVDNGGHWAASGGGVIVPSFPDETAAAVMAAQWNKRERHDRWVAKRISTGGVEQ